MRYTDPRRKGEKEEKKEMQQFIGHDFFFFYKLFSDAFQNSGLSNDCQSITG